ncbi:hypothetical protein NDU88_002835 [Pleurodeles waltl]|uniref:Uncharacterized protein n=1 Tax=Pleurodeles waltl TaxID=8319 RepID=A0AAV7MQT0_PLEWA|nr:hypothetical protein NDU88_002835 [Pleurodeles waltl]
MGKSDKTQASCSLTGVKQVVPPVMMQDLARQGGRGCRQYDLAAKAGSWGDFNYTLDPLLDRSGGGDHRPAAAAGAVTKVASDLGLVDIWRDRHPDRGGYAHYSSAHNLHTCIDLWLVARSLLGGVHPVVPWPRTYSYHSPVPLTVTVGIRVSPFFSWRYPPYSLLDSVFPKELATVIKDFFQINKSLVASVGTVWETLKVCIRGVTISKHAGVLRSIRGRLCMLEWELAQFEQEQVLNADDQTSGHMRDKLTEFQDTALTEDQHLGKYATAWVYGHGERPGSALANVIHPNKES